MDKVQIEWGNLDRTEAIEKEILDRCSKVLERAQSATNLIVHFQVVNPKSSAGPATQKVSMELRLPQHQDVRAERESEDLYQSIKDVQLAVLSQVKAKKDQHQI